MSRLSIKKYVTLSSERERAIADAEPGKNDYSFQPNELAGILHPSVQYATILDMKDVSRDIRLYTLAPDESRGTKVFAPFFPGQFISVRYQIGQLLSARPYSICSSPSDPHLQIAVKAAQNGQTSLYAHENWKPGDRLELSAPMGTFGYEKLRDSKQLVCLAGGSGITPFLSMAKAFAEGELGCESMTLFYGCRTVADAAFLDQFEKISAKTSRFRCIPVYSEERRDGSEFGLIDRSLIEKFVQGEASYFICGPEAMKNFIMPQLAEMGVERKFIRAEVQHGRAFLSDFPDAPKPMSGSVRIDVLTPGSSCTIQADTEKTILDNLEANGIRPVTGCRSGVCGLCRCILLEGTVFNPDGDAMLRMGDAGYRQIHLCRSFPMTDLKLNVCL